MNARDLQIEYSIVFIVNTTLYALIAHTRIIAITTRRRRKKESRRKPLKASMFMA